jgi:hypothetical protein
MTRGHRDWLGLRRTALASATTYRSPGARRGFDDSSSPSAKYQWLELSLRQCEGTLFNITHEGSARTITEHERRGAEIEALRAGDGSNAEAVD